MRFLYKLNFTNELEFLLVVTLKATWEIWGYNKGVDGLKSCGVWRRVDGQIVIDIAEKLGAASFFRV
jgi:hypothetical protein